MTSRPGLVVTFESPGRPGLTHARRGRARLGRVLAWEPPRRLAYLWHLGTDRSCATEIDISFSGDTAASIVTITRG